LLAVANSFAHIHSELLKKNINVTSSYPYLMFMELPYLESVGLRFLKIFLAIKEPEGPLYPAWRWVRIPPL
jgi:hypothetical protein